MEDKSTKEATDTDDKMNKISLQELEQSVTNEVERELIESLKDVARSLYRQVMPEDDIFDCNLEFKITGRGQRIRARSRGELRPEEEEKRREVERLVGKLSDFYHTRHVAPTAYHFINAPHDCDEMTWAEDQESNTVQNETMLKLMYPDEKEREHVREKYCKFITVKTQHEMMEEIRNAFNRATLNVSRLAFVFNGEGAIDKSNKPYLCFCDDSGPKESMSMDNFREQLRSVWADSIKAQAEEFDKEEDNPEASSVMSVPTGDQAMEVDTTMDKPRSVDYSGIMDSIPPIPSRVSVIFGQCYSGYYKQQRLTKSDWGSEMELVPLTTPHVDNGEAYCRFEFYPPLKGEPKEKTPGFLRRILSARHFDLNLLAKKIAKRRARNSDDASDAGFLPLGVRQEPIKKYEKYDW